VLVCPCNRVADVHPPVAALPRCLYVSREAAWLPGELEANLALGVVYEELKVGRGAQGTACIASGCDEAGWSSGTACWHPSALPAGVFALIIALPQ
jgi:hypothetical protein